MELSPIWSHKIKILRFGDDRIGVVKQENTVVDITDAIKGSGSLGGQGVVEELIVNFGGYRPQLDSLSASEGGDLLDSVGTAQA
ncbi:MAG TPA: hypothetical protein EYQ82_04025 [Dehalococcoidia bacterium]|jgi:hypothetical protein|nr:hypothetical protein [Dehalococcoidia bacterium]